MAGDLIGTPEDGVATPDEVRASTVAALEREREGYKRRLAGAVKDEDKEKLEARIADVDAAIKVAKKRPAKEKATVDEPEAEQATVE